MTTPEDGTTITIPGSKLFPQLEFKPVSPLEHYHLLIQNNRLLEESNKDKQKLIEVLEKENEKLEESRDKWFVFACIAYLGVQFVAFIWKTV